MRIRRILLILPLLAAALEAQERATVVTADNGWTYNGARAYRGRVVDAGIGKTPFAFKGASGALLLACNRGMISYVCKQNCSVPPCATQQDVGNSVAAAEHGAFMGMVQRLFNREPQEVASLGVRGGGNPVDALLLMDPKGIHWGPALARVLEGKYCLRLTPLPAGAPRVVAIDWDRGLDAEGLAPAAGVPAGLYSLDKGTPGGGACTLEPDAKPSWALIEPEAQFNRDNPVWKQHAAELTQVERSDAGPNIAAELRHALLATLADSAPVK